MGMYVSGTPRRDLKARNVLVRLEEDGSIHTAGSATVHRNTHVLWHSVSGLYGSVAESKDEGERSEDLKHHERTSSQTELGRFLFDAGNWIKLLHATFVERDQEHLVGE